MQRKYGWRKDHPNLLKKFYESVPHFETNAVLAPFSDLEARLPDAWDQLDTSSCTAHSGAGQVAFLEPKFNPSRLFLYWNSRVADGDPTQDAGSSISTVIQVMKDKGICAEQEWPFQVNDLYLQPNEKCFTDATAYVDESDYSITDLYGMKHCLTSGFPFMFGISVYSYMESAYMAQNPILRLPQASETFMGGHALLAVGHDDSTQRFKVRNSWGKSWGQNGYFYIPYDYITNTQLASDFWTILKLKT